MTESGRQKLRAHALRMWEDRKARDARIANATAALREVTDTPEWKRRQVEGLNRYWDSVGRKRPVEFKNRLAQIMKSPEWKTKHREGCARFWANGGKKRGKGKTCKSPEDLAQRRAEVAQRILAQAEERTRQVMAGFNRKEAA